MANLLPGEGVRNLHYRMVVNHFVAGLRDVLATMLPGAEVRVQRPESAEALPGDLAAGLAPRAVAFGLSLRGPVRIEGALVLSGEVVPLLVGTLMGSEEPLAELGPNHVPVLRDTLTNICGRWGQALEEIYEGPFEVALESTGALQAAGALGGGVVGRSEAVAIESIPIAMVDKRGHVQLILIPATVDALGDGGGEGEEPFTAGPAAPAESPAAQVLADQIAREAAGAPDARAAAPAPAAPRPAPVREPVAPPIQVSQPAFQQLTGHENGGGVSRGMDLILDVPLTISVELGRKSLNIREILELGPGSLVELDKLAGEPLDLLVNGKLFAHGEVVVIDESFGIRINSIISPQMRLQHLT